MLDNDTDGFANGTVTVNYDADTEATELHHVTGATATATSSEGYDAFAAFKLDQDANRHEVPHERERLYPRGTQSN